MREGARLSLEEYRVQITHIIVKLERRQSIRKYLTIIYLFIFVEMNCQLKFVVFFIMTNKYSMSNFVRCNK